MYLAGLDTETELISDETTLPPLVCLSYSSPQTGTDLVRYEHAADVFELFVDDPEAHLVFHNAAFDLGVMGRHETRLMPKIFDVLDANRVHDTGIREMLAEIKHGTLEYATRQKGYFKLDALTKRHLNRELAKGEDSWQTHFAELKHIPLVSWPRGARDYATADAATCRELCGVQKKAGPFPDETAQVRAAFALRLASEYGMITDEARVDAFELSLLEASVDKLALLEQAGIVRSGLRSNGKPWPKSKMGTTDMQALQARIVDAFAAMGLEAPRTNPDDMSEKFREKFPRGQIKTDEETLAMCLDDPVLQARAAVAKISKLLTTYIPALRRGCYLPIHADLRVLVETGRTSCAEPNLQNLPRKPGARECFTTRRGKVFLSVDYRVAELRALAQICHAWFGFSTLRDAFASFPEWSPDGVDPHLVLAADMLSMSVPDAHVRRDDPKVNDTRQVAKVGNFGFAGGLGAETFVTYARGQGVRVDISRAKDIKATWRNRWTEISGPYFGMIAQITSELGERSITQYRSERVRGGVTFTEACNGYFQGLVADFAKEAFYEVTKACYVHETSPLYGARPVLFLHDEILLEVDEEQAHDAAAECEVIMQAVQARWLPDVPPATDAHLMRAWSKKAKRAVDRHGRLIPWEDRL
jgi:hypothetical protein